MKRKIIYSTVILMMAGSISCLYGGSEGDAKSNAYYGLNAGGSLSDGEENVFVGVDAGRVTNKGGSNTFVGRSAGYANTKGDDNTFIGRSAGYANTEGSRNTAVGHSSGHGLSNGFSNVFVGYAAGYSVGEGHDNTFCGDRSGYSTTLGYSNTFFGFSSGYSNTTGSNNTFIGYHAGSNANVNRSVFIGSEAGYNATRSNTLYIANSETERPLIYGEFDTKRLKVHGSLTVTGPMEAKVSKRLNASVNRMLTLSFKNKKSDKGSDAGLKIRNMRENFSWLLRSWERKKGFAILKEGGGASSEFLLYNRNASNPETVVLRLANGAYCDGVWHNASSRTLKKDIEALSEKEALEAFEKLQPVTFVYKSNPDDPHVGFIAEELPDLVADPGRKSVSTLDVVALLTKVVQSQKRELAAKDREIAEMKKKMNEKEHELEALRAKQAAMFAKIEEFDSIKKRLSSLEHLLSGLALDTEKNPERFTEK